MMPRRPKEPGPDSGRGQAARGRIDRRRLLECAAACLPLIYFAASGLRHLERPALYHDELLFIAPAMDAGPWRLRIISYIGALKACLYVPVFAYWDVSPASVRVPSLLVAVVTLASFHAFLRGRVGWPFAWVGLAVLGLDPAFGFLTRVDYGPNALMHALKAASLLLLAAFLERGAVAALWALVAALLLGLYDKLNFVWIILALGAATVVAHGGTLYARLRERPAAVLAPLIVLAGVTATVFLVAIRPLLAETQPGTGSPVSYRARVPLILGLVQRTVDGAEPYNWAALTDRLPPTGVFVALHGMVMVNVLVAWRRRRQAGTEDRSRWRWLLFLLTCEAALLAQMVYTRAAHGPHHAMLLWPLPHLAAVLSAVLAIRPGAATPARRRGRQALIAGNALAFLFIAAAHGRTASRYADLYRGETALGPRFDTRVYDLGAFLDERRDRFHTIVVLDPGLAQPLRALARRGERMRVRNLWPAFQRPVEGEREGRRLLRRHFPGGRIVLALSFRRDLPVDATIGRNWRRFVQQTLGDRVSAHAELFGLFEAWCVSGKDDCGLEGLTAPGP